MPTEAINPEHVTCLFMQLDSRSALRALHNKYGSLNDCRNDEFIDALHQDHGQLVTEHQSTIELSNRLCILGTNEALPTLTSSFEQTEALIEEAKNSINADNYASNTPAGCWQQVKRHFIRAMKSVASNQVLVLELNAQRGAIGRYHACSGDMGRFWFRTFESPFTFGNDVEDDLFAEVQSIEKPEEPLPTPTSTEHNIDVYLKSDISEKACRDCSRSLELFRERLPQALASYIQIIAGKELRDPTQARAGFVVFDYLLAISPDDSFGLLSVPETTPGRTRAALSSLRPSVGKKRRERPHGSSLRNLLGGSNALAWVLSCGGLTSLGYGFGNLLMVWW